MKVTKRQYLPAGLWVVATPIGNLEDLSPRAKQALEEADLIVCEDTRRTGALLSALGIPGSTVKLDRLDAHTEVQKIPLWMRRLEDGSSLALVTDAGTPAISDPGAALTAAAKQAGVRITPVPGPSAVVALLSVSGFLDASFTFRGFFPRKTKDQEKEIELASRSPLSSVYLWYESPLRIEDSLTQIAVQFPQVQTVVAKELTKIHERLFYGTADEVRLQVIKELETEGRVGEWSFSIQFPKTNPTLSEARDEDGNEAGWIKAIRCLLEFKVPVSETAAKVSQEFGIPKNKVYQASLEIKGKKSSS